jgi:putative phosphonate catabolism associated alcohol dehydrogenase
MNNTPPSFPQGRAAIFNGYGQPFEFVRRSLPVIGPGEILIKNLYTTLCGSDIHTYCGRRQEPPHVVLGHEIVGDILWIDSTHPHVDFRGASIKAGDRITWSIFAVPGSVTPPRADMPQKSEQLFKYGHHLAKDNDVFNGGLADYCIIRSNTAIIKISPSMPVKVAATINCAQATVRGALRVAGEIKGKKILVFGAGLLGLSCAAMCREAGASTIGIVDPETSRLEWAGKFGADAKHIFPDEIKGQQLPWPEADIIFDMTGSPGAMRTGIDSLAVGGIAIWIGAVYPAQPVQVDAQKIVRKVLQIRGLHNYNYEDFVLATEFIENFYEKYPFEALIEKEYSMEDIEKAFAFASEKKPVRVGIKIN